MTTQHKGKGKEITCPACLQTKMLENGSIVEVDEKDRWQCPKCGIKTPMIYALNFSLNKPMTPYQSDEDIKQAWEKRLMDVCNGTKIDLVL